MGDAPTSEFEKLLVWAYEGEVFGEALFTRLALAFPAEREALETLAHLEQMMAGRLLHLIERHAIEMAPVDKSRAGGRHAADAIAAGDWSSFIAQFGPATEDALEKYQQLRDRAPGPSRREVDLLIAHELALQAFAASHAGGEARGALHEVRQVIARLEGPRQPG